MLHNRGSSDIFQVVYPAPWGRCPSLTVHSMMQIPMVACTLLWGAAHASHLQSGGRAAVVGAWNSVQVPSSHKYDVV